MRSTEKQESVEITTCSAEHCLRLGDYKNGLCLLCFERHFTLNSDLRNWEPKTGFVLVRKEYSASTLAERNRERRRQTSKEQEAARREQHGD
jgi:hypothetical protein